MIAFGSALDRTVFWALGSGLRATVASLAARAMRGLRNACRPSGVASGFIADVTRSPAELIAENALLRQQLIVASRGHLTSLGILRVPQATVRVRPLRIQRRPRLHGIGPCMPRTSRRRQDSGRGTAWDRC